MDRRSALLHTYETSDQVLQAVKQVLQVPDGTSVVDHAQALREALTKIRSVVGTSTEAWHIANNALGGVTPQRQSTWSEREGIDWHDRSTWPACCVEAAKYGGSHYHCANCGEVAGMYGHYSGEKRDFTCKPSGSPPA